MLQVVPEFRHTQLGPCSACASLHYFRSFENKRAWKNNPRNSRNREITIPREIPDRVIFFRALRAQKQRRYGGIAAVRRGGALARPPEGATRGLGPKTPVSPSISLLEIRGKRIGPRGNIPRIPHPRERLKTGFHVTRHASEA